jgi:hypothetical protein
MYVPIARARDARFTRAIPRSASPTSHASHAKTRLSKFHYGTKLWASQNIFAGLPNIGFSKYGHILGKTLCSGPRRQPGWQAQGGTALAPRHHVRCPWDFLGLERTSLVRNNERYLAFPLAVSRAFLEGSDLRCRFLVNHLPRETLIKPSLSSWFKLVCGRATVLVCTDIDLQL